MTVQDRRPGVGAATPSGDPVLRDPRTAPAASAMPEPESFESEPTRAGMGVAASARAAPARRSAPVAVPMPVPVQVPVTERSAPVAMPERSVPVAVPATERSEPIQVFSMKEHTEAQQRRSDEHRVPLHVQLRTLAEVSGRNDTPVRLGHLAPPRDPRQARVRRWRDNVVWGCVAIVLASVIAIVVWLIAGR